MLFLNVHGKRIKKMGKGLFRAERSKKNAWDVIDGDEEDVARLKKTSKHLDPKRIAAHKRDKDSLYDEEY
jgi:hypothetical protein